MGWRPRADGAHAWQHDLCCDTTIFRAGINPNKPWRKCPQCLSDAGAWHDCGVAGDGDNRRPHG